MSMDATTLSLCITAIFAIEKNLDVCRCAQFKLLTCGSPYHMQTFIPVKLMTINAVMWFYEGVSSYSSHM